MPVIDGEIAIIPMVTGGKYHQPTCEHLLSDEFLRAIVAPNLLPLASGQGQVLATEICIVTNAIRNHIRERTVHQIYSEMQTGRKHQMQTMDGALLDLYQRGEITYDAALSNAREPSHIQHKAGMTNSPTA